MARNTMHQSLLGRICHAANIWNWHGVMRETGALVGEIVGVRVTDDRVLLTLATGKGRVFDHVFLDQVILADKGTTLYEGREDAFYGAPQLPCTGAPHQTSNRRLCIVDEAVDGGQVALMVCEPSAHLPWGGVR